MTTMGMNPAGGALHFEGRFKTVKQKRVEYTEKISPKDTEAMIGIGTVSAVTGLLPMMAIGHPAALVIPISSGFLPASLCLGEHIAKHRKVHWEDVQVEMTPEEIEATMTPLEKAQEQVTRGLQKWADLRQAHLKKFQHIQHSPQELLRELEGLRQDVAQKQAVWERYQAAGIDEDRLEGQPPYQFKLALDQAGLQLVAKEEAFARHQKVVDAALMVYQELDKEIQQREALLYKTQEDLKLLGYQDAIVSMNDQLNAVRKQTPAEGVAQGKDGQALQLDLEVQRVKIEALMKSIETAVDVENVLKKVSAKGGVVQ